MSKIIDYFKPVDPFIKYIPEERSYELLVLHFKISIISIIGFIIYSIVNVILFVLAPEPSELTIMNIFTNMTSAPIFQLGIAIPVTGYSCSTGDMVFPFDSQITKNVQNYDISVTSDNSNYQYKGYSFPIYGTVDAKSGTSYIVVFKPCISSNIPNIPLPLSISIVMDPTIVLNKFKATTGASGSIILTSDQSNVITSLVYTDKTSNLFINSQINLIKTVDSKGKANYNAEFVGPAKFIPNPVLSFSDGPKLLVDVNPTVTVLTYKPKNPLTLIGSISGIFPVFIMIGNFISEKINSFKNRNKDIPMEENKILNN